MKIEENEKQNKRAKGTLRKNKRSKLNAIVATSRDQKKKLQFHFTYSCYLSQVLVTL